MLKYQAFHASLVGVGIEPKINVFDELLAAYSEPSRHYHTQKHISQCLSHFNEFRSLATSPCEIEIALWFHDAVYDTRRSDNEAMSAQWAERYLTSEAAAPPVIAHIVTMILTTQTHNAYEADTALLVDIDLGILGAAPDVFEAYDQAIRQEYHWVPEAQYRTTRCQILKAFLDREVIYQTEEIRRCYEAQARENLSRKVHQLAIS